VWLWNCRWTNSWLSQEAIDALLYLIDLVLCATIGKPACKVKSGIPNANAVYRSLISVWWFEPRLPGRTTASEAIVFDSSAFNLIDVCV
jgi:hypothetical protein